MKNKKMVQFLVHRLVARAFLRNKYNKPHINHMDGNKVNNNIENLEWCTRKENQAHASKIGLYKKGEGHGSSKLNNLQVRVIRYLDDITNDITQEKRWQRIGRFFGVSWTAVRDIIARKTWKHTLN